MCIRDSYVAGHAYGRGKPFATIFFCNFGAFLCFVTLPDERLIAQQIMFFGIAGMQLFLSWMLVSGLRRRAEIFARFPNAPATEDEDLSLIHIWTWRRWPLTSAAFRTTGTACSRRS